MPSETANAYRGASYEVAEAIAPGWERQRANIEEVSAPVREWLVRELNPEPGHIVLELAAGAGDTGFDVAEVIGPTGRLITTDFSPSMLAIARRRGAERGVSNVEYRLVDAERMELDDASVDGVLCRFGYMLMADASTALAETRRVLRPGARVTLAVWGPPERNPFFGIIAVSLVQHGHLQLPLPDTPGIFSMASPARTTELLEAAGFDHVRTEEVDVRFVLPDVDTYLDVVADTAGAIALVVRELADSEREQIRAELDESFARFTTDGGYELPGVALCAAAS